MVYQLYNLRVKKVNYGWIVQRLVGKQYKDSRFFNNLSDALIYVLDYQLERLSKHDKIILDQIVDTKIQLEKYVNYNVSWFPRLII